MAPFIPWCRRSHVVQLAGSKAVPADAGRFTGAILPLGRERNHRAVTAKRQESVMSISSRQYRMLRLVRLFRRLQKIWVDWRGTSGQIYFEHRVGEYERIWGHVAEVLDAELIRLADEVWEFRRGKQRTRVNNYQLEYDNPVVLRIAGNKPLVHQLLVNRDLPVPLHKTFTLRDLDVANSFLKGHTQGCVVKPADGFGGKGVTTHVQNYTELKRAAVLASLYSPNLLIEQQIPGESYRLLVLNGKMVHAVCRRGLRLQADGTSSIADDTASPRHAQFEEEFSREAAKNCRSECTAQSSWGANDRS